MEILRFCVDMFIIIRDTNGYAISVTYSNDVARLKVSLSDVSQ